MEKHIMQWNDSIFGRKSGSKTEVKMLILSYKYWDKSIQIIFQTKFLVAYISRTSYKMERTR